MKTLRNLLVEIVNTPTLYQDELDAYEEEVKQLVIRELLEKQLKKTNSQKCECELDIWVCPYCQVKEMMKELEGEE